MSLRIRPRTEGDPILAASQLGWPKEVLLCLAKEGYVAEKLLSAGYIRMTTVWKRELRHMKQAALAGNPPPQEARLAVLEIFLKAEEIQRVV